jgi:hypothetical protein
MTDDFIRRLQSDLVEAMERYERRGSRRRFASGTHLPGLRPATLARVAAAAAVVVAVVVAARNLAPETPPARPHVVAVLTIGGTPVDAALAEGSLWASDFTGSVVQIDPSDRRVIARIEVPGAPQPVATDSGSIWVQTLGSHCDGNLVHIDATSGSIVGRTRQDYPSEGAGDAVLAVAGGGVWLKRGCPRQSLDRLDRTGRVTAHVALASVDGLAPAAGNLWAIGHDGTLTQIDAASGRVRKRWPELAPLSDPTTSSAKALVADGVDAWVLSSGRAAILHIERGRIVGQILVDAAARPLLAKAPDGLWIASSDRLAGHNRLIRINPHTGKPTATLQLGDQRPIALIPTDGQLCAVTADGKILFIQS